MSEPVTIARVGDLGTILGVWAHPDDETYLSAGLMAAAVRNGQRVVCVTATRGEKGSWDEERWPSETMGDVRAQELLRCLAILGVTEHVWLDYVDGECHGVPLDEGVGRVASLIAEVRPDTVLTFGPDGQTGHLDHKAVSAWTTEAVARAPKPRPALYYATVTPEWAERFVDRLNEFNVFEPGTPAQTARADLGIDVELPPDLLDLKARAIREHASQVEGMLSVFGDGFFREAMLVEPYRRG